MRFWGWAWAIIVVLAVAGVIAWRAVWPEHSPLDSGPFAGQPVSAPAGKPTSSVAMRDYTFACHNVTGAPPIVVSRRSNGEVVGAWQMSLPPSFAPDVVAACQLGQAAGRGREGYLVYGVAEWRSGRKHATFYFGADGRLLGFYLGW